MPSGDFCVSILKCLFFKSPFAHSVVGGSLQNTFDRGSIFRVESRPSQHTTRKTRIPCTRPNKLRETEAERKLKVFSLCLPALRRRTVRGPGGDPNLLTKRDESLDTAGHKSSRRLLTRRSW